MGGRFYSVIGAIIGVIIMIIMIMIGYSKLKDKRTSVALMTVKSATCVQLPPTGQGSTPGGYSCNVIVTFTTPDGNTYTPKNQIKVTSATPLAPGDTIPLRYDPKNPIDVAQEISPRTLGWGLIGGGILLGSLSVGAAVLSFKSRGFAAVEGSLAAIGAITGKV